MDILSDTVLLGDCEVVYFVIKTGRNYRNINDAWVKNDSSVMKYVMRGESKCAGYPLRNTYSEPG